MITTALLPLLLALAPSTVTATRSAKRGIVYVSPEVVSDNNFWTNNSTDLDWYYNYQSQPTTAFAKSQMQFVPMQWGLPENPDSDMSFYNAVKSLQQAGLNVTWVLGYNEPDGCTDGGSCVDPKEAAIAWVKQFEPMRRDLGVKLGGPACTGGSTGWTWLASFHHECANQHGNNTGCLMDFLPIHWYGSFEGLAGHLGQVNGTYTNITEFWVTEFAFNDEPLNSTQQFYNQSTEYFDKLDLIEKYAYFGPFRSDVSNIGPNAAFLTQDGKLTDIGSWYLGGDATGNIPSSKGGSTFSIPSGLLACVAAASAWMLF